MNPVVVVGSGIAGIRAAEAIRAHKYLGEILIIDPELPSYRPAVSKEALKSRVLDGFGMPMKRSADEFTWLIGHGVVNCSLDGQHLWVSDPDGQTSTIHFDGLIIASGLRSRHLTVPGPTAGRFTLRTIADAQLLEPMLVTGARIAIVGSGFIGCEVAAIASERGCEVTVVSPEAVPLSSALGDEVGQRIANQHERHGVNFRTKRIVAAFGGDERATSLLLDDGTEVQADVVVEAVGSIPNIDWLNGNTLDLSNGVLTDQYLQAVGTTAPVRACGDIARHPNALFGMTPRRIEHWTTAADLGAHAGRGLAKQLNAVNEPEVPFAAVPAFWSDQYDLQIQSFGIPSIATEVNIIESADDGSCIAEYFDSSGLVGVVGINRTSQIAGYRRSLAGRI
ncbi:MAG: FAD-dependent oxidoreductase [Candidatus Nanopelagicales bacterium]|nr:FAD-dependent oxidoreductase [Candidatus Nanopelagicales bacterium]MDD2819046.1 FAD-dependent oxidoreductase [Candidatus Nanopelagicales bacterium]